MLLKPFSLSSSSASGSSLSRRLYGGFSLSLKRKPTRKDLDFYDVIWVGGNIGAICSSHFDKISHGKYKMMAVFD